MASELLAQPLLARRGIAPAFWGTSRPSGRLERHLMSQPPLHQPAQREAPLDSLCHAQRL